MEKGKAPRKARRKLDWELLTAKARKEGESTVSGNGLPLILQTFPNIHFYGPGHEVRTDVEVLFDVAADGRPAHADPLVSRVGLPAVPENALSANGEAAGGAGRQQEVARFHSRGAGEGLQREGLSSVLLRFRDALCFQVAKLRAEMEDTPAAAAAKEQARKEGEQLLAKGVADEDLLMLDDRARAEIEALKGDDRGCVFLIACCLPQA